MARKRYDDEPENHERWLISYADFITLLFAFFVVMYAISSVNLGKYKVFSDALGDAFRGEEGSGRLNPEIPQIMPMPSTGQRRRTEALKKEKDFMTRLAHTLISTLAPLVKEGKVRVTQNSRGVSVEINASVLFDPGQATLTDSSVEALSAIGILLKDDPHSVQVEGHTDDVPISNVIFPSNWELSSVRAASVVRLFIANGVAPNRLTAVGFADNVPVAPNDTPVNRARNRRVAVTILSAIPDPVQEIPTGPAPQPIQ